MITVELTDEEQQTVILALARLSCERPGMDSFLNGIALKFELRRGDRAKLYDRFRKIHRSTAWHRVLDNADTKAPE